jgi:hypothetical protein
MVVNNTLGIWLANMLCDITYFRVTKIKKILFLMINNTLEDIIIAYRGEIDDPLDGDKVDDLCELLKIEINLHEGNITDKEYKKLIS